MYTQFVIVYPFANSVYVNGHQLEFKFKIPNHLPQDMTLLHWNDPNLKGSLYRLGFDSQNIDLETTEDNFNIWVKPFVDMWNEERIRHLQQQLTDVIQNVLDSKAKELNYDSCLSVCSYIDTGIQKFDDEGKAFRAWRSQVWALSYQILDEVTSGLRSIPTEQELIALLPELKIEYTATEPVEEVVEQPSQREEQNC